MIDFKQTADRSGSFFLLARATACALALLVGTAGVATAADAEEPLRVAAADDGWTEHSACSGEVGERIAFLEERLDGDRVWSNRWWTGWTSFFAIGVAVSAYNAEQQRDHGQRAIEVVSAVKALFGTTRLYFFDGNGRHGADNMRAVVADSPAGCRRRMEVGELDLVKNAKQSNQRFSWKPHAANVAINVAGAGIVDGFYNNGEDAWIAAGIGIAIGEIMQWTRPRRAPNDLETYKATFPSGLGRLAAADWTLYPHAGGLGVRASF